MNAPAPNASHIPTARELGVIECHGCGMVLSFSPKQDGYACPRCGVGLHRRKPHSVRRSWALLLAAAVLYIPANVLPIMRTETLLAVDDDTILSGVVRLWENASYDLAIIVFVASIVVPMLKIGTLALLLWSVQRRNNWSRVERGQLYRFIDAIGHWSMLDIFVAALLTALVHFKALADVQVGPGAIAFGAVVVLTMMASKEFDPRLIWDEPAAAPPPVPHTTNLSHDSTG